MLPVLLTTILAIIKSAFFLIGYLTNTSSFPQPLSPEEEQHYIEMFKNGSEEAKNVLIERNLRLVAHIVKKYNSTGSDCDDLISIGTIGLIKAISSFDMQKGTKLATYAARCIENEILMTKDTSADVIKSAYIKLISPFNQSPDCNLILKLSRSIPRLRHILQGISGLLPFHSKHFRGWGLFL